MDTQPPGSMGGTFAGNAVSCAAAVATIDVIKQEKLLENANVRGKQLKDGLFKLKEKYDIIGDIRGLGLMIGVQFDGKKVKYGTAGIISKECTKNGMLLLTTSVFETLRFIPPLVATEEEIAMGLNIFEKSIQNTLSQIKN